MKQETLTKMQQGCLDILTKLDTEADAGYIAKLYYESTGERRPFSSRHRFGQTSAAYRTLRKLESLGLVQEKHSKTTGGYSIYTYMAIPKK